MFKSRKIFARATLACAAGLAAQVVSEPAAAAPVYDTPSSTIGDQTYTGLVGNDFTVNRAVTVMALGAFDSPRDQITDNVSIGIYDLTTSSWAVGPVSFLGAADPGGAPYVWKSVAPVTLTAGDSYSMYGEGFGSTDRIYNTTVGGTTDDSPITFDSLGGALTNGYSRYNDAQIPNEGVSFPDSSAFAAGTFDTTAGVPEPATWSMMLFGFGLLGSTLRRRQAVLAD